jgi:hypothetical protein
MWRSWQKFVSLIQSLNAVRLVAEWFGWKVFLASAAASISLTAWGWIEGNGLPLMVSAGTGVFVAILYLTLFPRIRRIFDDMEPSDAPNAAIWSLRDRYKLVEAASLLADIRPSGVIPPGDAEAWYSVLEDAIKSGELPHVITSDDAQQTHTDGFHAHHNTRVTKEALRAYLDKKNVTRPFLSLG